MAFFVFFYTRYNFYLINDWLSYFLVATKQIISQLPIEHQMYPCLVLSHQENLQRQKQCLVEWNKIIASVNDLHNPLHSFTYVFHKYG